MRKNISTGASGFKTELTVGEVAERTGVAVSTLHFYEKKGLIRSWRTAGGRCRRLAPPVPSLAPGTR